LATTFRGRVLLPMDIDIALVTIQSPTQNRFVSPGTFPFRSFNSSSTIPNLVPFGALQLIISSNFYVSTSVSSAMQRGNIEIAAVGNVGEQIKGTFSGTLVSESNQGRDTIVISGGRFSLIRIRVVQ